MFTLGRDIDIHYPTNRLILIIAALSAVLGVFLFGDLLTGVKMGAAIFLAWVFGREADPKREYAAFVGVAIALLYSVLSDVFMIAFIELLFVVLLLRIINTTAGKNPTLFDAGVTLALAIYLYMSENNPLFLFIYFIGLFISQAFKDDQLLNIFLAAAAGGSGGYTLYLLNAQSAFSSPILSPTSLLLIAGLYGLTAYLDKNKKIYDDAGYLIDSDKIFYSQIFFAVLVLLLAFLSEPLITNMIIYIAAMAGSIIYRPINIFFKFEP